MDEGKLWSLIRNVLSQGGAIQLDRASMSGYEEYSERLDAAASDRVAEFAKLAESAIAARDTEIARLQTDLELARMDAERARKGANYWRVKAKSPTFPNPMSARPTDEQFIAIHEAWLSAQGIAGNGAVFNGMAIYDAACEVMTDRDAARAGNGGEG